MTKAAAASGGKPPAADEKAPGVDPLAARAFALLVVACLAAFFVTQRLKHTPTAIQEVKLTPRFSPTPAGHVKEESISFKLPRAERITVQIIDTGAGDVVATLARDLLAPRYKKISLRWNGRRGPPASTRVQLTPAGSRIVRPRNRGPLAAAGEYRVRVERRHGRAILVPRSFTLVRP